MTWTYTNDPSTVERDAVRLLIGDTDTTDQQLTDEEIAYFIALFPDTWGAACAAAKAISGKYARLVDKEVGDLKIMYSQRKEMYDALCESLKEQAALTPAAPFFGGRTTADKQGEYDDTSQVQPYFKRDQFDNGSVLEDSDTLL